MKVASRQTFRVAASTARFRPAGRSWGARSILGCPITQALPCLAILAAIPLDPPAHSADAVVAKDAPLAPAEAGQSRLGRNADLWELRFGGGAYDAGAFSTADVDAVSINAEMVAPSPDFLSAIGSPRPYLGFNAVTGDDDLAFFYAGLNWEAYWTNRLYTGFSLGGAVATDTRNSDVHDQDLGCNGLLHLVLHAGFDMTEGVTAQVYVDHFSNADLCDSNDGVETAGLRLGLRF